MGAALAFRDLGGIEAAEARLDEMVRRARTLDLREVGERASRALSSGKPEDGIRALFREQAAGPGRRFAEFQLELPRELAARMANVDPVLVHDRVATAAQRALNHALPAFDGVASVRVGADNRPRVDALVSCPEWIKPVHASAAMERVERAWQREVYKAFGLKVPGLPDQRERLSGELREVVEIKQEAYRLALDARVHGKGSSASVAEALSAVRSATERYRSFVDGARVLPSVRPAAPAMPAPPAARIQFAAFIMERGGESLGRLDQKGQTAMVQEAVDRVLGKGTRVMAGPVVGDSRNLEVMVTSAQTALDRAARARLVESLPTALSAIFKEKGLDLPAPGRVLFAEAKAPSKSADVLRAVPEGVSRAKAEMPMPARSPLDETNMSRQVFLPSAGKWLVQVPAAERDAVLNEALRRALPELKGGLLNSRLSGDGVALNVTFVRSASQMAMLEHPLVPARVTNELVEHVRTKGLAPSPEKGIELLGNEKAAALPSPEKPLAGPIGIVGGAARDGVGREAGALAGSVAREGLAAAGKEAASTATKAAGQAAGVAGQALGPVSQVVTQGASVAQSVVSGSYDLVKEGFDAHAVAHKALGILTQAMPPILQQSAGRFMGRIGRELIEITKGRE